MSDMSVYVEWRLPQFPRRNDTLFLPVGTKVGDFLQQIGLNAKREELLVIVNGRSALWEDPILPESKIILLPILCGG